MRVLVVEDNDLTRELLEVNLREHGGHEVVRAGTADEALTRRVLWRPDAVVLDVMLPGMDGLELVGKLREVSAREGLPRVPVVVITALAGQDLESATARLPAIAPARLLRKPFDTGELLNILEELAQP